MELIMFGVVCFVIGIAIGISHKEERIHKEGYSEGWQQCVVANYGMFSRYRLIKDLDDYKAGSWFYKKDEIMVFCETDTEYIGIDMADVENFNEWFELVTE